MQKSGNLGICAVYPSKEGEEKAKMRPVSPSITCTSSSPAFQKTYCHPHGEDPNFYKNLKVHMDFGKRVGGNAKISINHLSLDDKVERLVIFICNFNVFKLSIMIILIS